jgi:hypothetical protein
MIRIATDFNWREGHTTIVLPDDVPVEVLVTGTRIILYEPYQKEWMECEAIVHPGERWPWVADIVKGTIKDHFDGNENSESNENTRRPDKA